MEGSEGIRSLPSYRKWLLAAAVVLNVFILAGFLLLPRLLRPVVEDRLTAALHRKTTIREIRINPFTLTVAVRGLEIAERGYSATWISAEEIYANLQLASVFRRGPVLSAIRLKRPYVSIVRRRDGSYNFSDLLDEYAGKSNKKSKSLKYSFNNIRLIDGSVDFLDGPKKRRHRVDGIQLSVPFITNLKYAVDRYVTPSFAAVVNGDAIHAKGWTKPFKKSLETAFEINISDLSLPTYLEYVPFPREYDIPSAHLDVKAILRFLQREDGPPSVSLDGYALLRDVVIVGKDRAPMIRLPWVRGVLFPADMGAGQYRLTSLTVENPEIDAVVDKNGKLNLLSLLPRKETDNSSDNNTTPADGIQDGSGGDAVFSIDSVRLSGGKVRFADASRNDPFKTELGDIRIDVDGFSTAKGKSAEAEMALSTEAGETVSLQGTFLVSPLASEGTVTAAKLALGKYAPYYRDRLRFDVVRGTLDFRTGYAFVGGPEGNRFRLQGLSAALNDLRLRQREEAREFLSIPSLSVDDARVDPERRELQVGKVSSSKGRVSIRRDAAGRLNVSRLLPEEAASPSPKEPSGSAGEAAPWLVTLDTIQVDGYEVALEDDAVSPRVEATLDGIRLAASEITTAKGRKGKFSFSTRYERQGALSLAGSISLDPLSMAGRLTAKQLQVGRLQPYWTERVKILVTDGKVSADGALRVDAPKGGPLRAGYKGEASVTGFDSVDKAMGEEFLKFDTLFFAGVDVSYQPTSVAIREVALSGFYSRIIVNEDGTLNVQGIVGKDGAGDNAAATPAAVADPHDAGAGRAAPHAAAVPVRIDALTLQGGDVNFSDRFVRPNYSAALTEIGGRVSGLSSDENKAADVDLRGRLGRTTPLEITGKINPLAKDLFLDLNVDFRDIELSPFTPYSGRYAGYGIQKGKLTLNLSYHIEKKKLDAQNKVFLDQFTFGDPVESPVATKLPVKLAVALLKDRKGEIRLDLPVSGRIDDPKFSVWRIIWKIIGNLLVKAATAPFALIGSLFGGGEELAYLEFEEGAADIPAAGMGKLRTLGKALYERPALKLEIAGHVDPDKDALGLRQARFRRKLAAQKVKALARSGQPAPAVDNVRIDASEYGKYLALAYKEEKFPKPRNVVGMAKDLPAPEMEKLMLTNIRVTEDDLRQLAVERATRVRDVLVAEGKIESGRIFLVEPKRTAPERKEKLKDSRVDFLIK